MSWTKAIPNIKQHFTQAQYQAQVQNMFFAMHGPNKVLPLILVAQSVKSAMGSTMARKCGRRADAQNGGVTVPPPHASHEQNQIRARHYVS